MKAIQIARFGGPDVLELVERPVPAPGPGEVLIAVEAAGVNRPDVLQRLGRYPPPPGVTDIPGLEIAGVVAKVGPPGPWPPRWLEGDRVCALVAGGGYAEYCLAPVPQCLPIPSGLDAVAAAALPETFFTVWTNVFERGRLQPTQTLLVHGGAGGIGTTAIQLGRAFGSRVIATAGSAEKCEACRRLGAEHAIDYRAEDFVSRVKEITAGRGVDVVLDIVGGAYVAKNLEVLARDGRLVQIGLMGGATAEIPLGPILQRRLWITGSTLRPRSVEEKGLIARALESRVWPLVARGEVRPVIHATFPLARAADAHRLMEAGGHIGKIVLVVREGGAPA
ncbi:MAG TPA: NAD(P)H-quinone oxidoreductase [Vicinamibacterales bacterium]|nr:NAD(P)H-quinone oxidoreductase [Vicinamibacterales bacterium]